MFRPLFFSQNTVMFEKVLLFQKITQKLSVFYDVYDYHLILGEKQRLKQIEKCSLHTSQQGHGNPMIFSKTFENYTWVLGVYKVMLCQN